MSRPLQMVHKLNGDDETEGRLYARAPDYTPAHIMSQIQNHAIILGVAPWNQKKTKT